MMARLALLALAVATSAFGSALAEPKACVTDVDCPGAYCMNDATKKPPFTCAEAKPYLPATGTQCKVDDDCEQSYCLNTPPHLPPYVCHDSDFPKCANPDLVCGHGGSIYQVGCTVDKDCTSVLPGSYCMNYAPHKAPFVCQSHDAPVCGCACVSNWVGPTCNKWNGTTPGPAAGKAAKKYFGRLRERQEAEQRSQAFRNPYSGWVGNGYDITAGGADGLKPSVVELLYTDATKTWKGHRLPVQADFTDNLGDASTLPAQFVHADTHDFGDFNDLRSYVGGLFNGLTKAPQLFSDIYSYASVPNAQQSFYRDDFGLSVASQTWEMTSMTLKAGTAPAMDRFVKMGIDSLPTGYTSDSEKAAYDVFISTWGTHYVTSATGGGMLVERVKYPYVLHSGSNFGWGKASASTIQSWAASDLQLASGLSLSGTPLSAAQKSEASKAVDSNGQYKDGRQRQPMTCAGGKAAELCNPGNMAAWVASLPSDPAPVRIQLAPISDLLADGNPAKATLAAVIAAKVKGVADAAAAVSPCAGVSCARGSCGSNGACGCPTRAYGRRCDHCEPGYGANHDCAAPVCAQGCNAAGGDCVSPNVCKCHNCYAGSNCMTYTCGCFDAEGRVTREADNASVPLSQVRVGDRVLSADAATGEAVFSDVFFVRTAKGEGAGQAEVVEVAVEGGRTLRLTTDHLVYVSDVWAPRGTPAALGRGVKAAEVRAGQYVWAPVAGEGGLGMRRVEGVRVEASAAPLVSVHTLAGPVIVDGVLASSYEVDDTAGRLESAEARLVYQYLPSVARSEWYQAHALWWDANVAAPFWQATVEGLVGGARAVSDAAKATLAAAARALSVGAAAPSA